MNTRFSEDRVENLGCAVGNLALLGKSVCRLHINTDGKNFLDSIQRFEASKQKSHRPHDADFRSQLSLRQGDILADSALDDDGIADTRYLSADISEIFVHNQWRIVSAHFDFAVKIVTKLNSNLSETRLSAHQRQSIINF